MEQTYKFKVAMTCSGCVNAVRNVLQKTAGVSHFDIELETKTVTVTSTLTQAETLQAIQKTGKETKVLEE